MLRRQFIVIGLVLFLEGCSGLWTTTTDHDNLIDAAMHRDKEAVRRLIAEGKPVEIRNHRGSTPLGLAASSDQHIIAEILLDAGADPFAIDSLFISAAGSVYRSRMSPDTPKGQARLRVLAKMEAAGVPLPPPRPKDFPQAFEDGRWPKHAMPPPLKKRGE